MAPSSIPFREFHQLGLKWIVDLFSTEPNWTDEPSIDIITKLAHQHLKLPGNEMCKPEPFAEGAFNKLFAIDCSKGKFIFRVSLPVAPGIKTKSEVATLAFLRTRTNIPVPEIIA